MEAIDSLSLFAHVHDPLLYVGGFTVSTFMVFMAVVTYPHHDGEDFPRFRQIGYSLGWRSRRSQALEYYG
jgi:hypothetical protein